MQDNDRDIARGGLARADGWAEPSSDGSRSRPFIIFDSEVRKIIAEAARWPDRETGGDLFGYWTHTGCPVVQYVLGAGPGARREVAAFFQDAEHLEREGRSLIDRYALQHLGEWHSHHSLGLERPSGGDASTIESALSRYRLPRFALVICTVQRDHQPNGCGASSLSRPFVAARNFLFTAGRGGYDEGPWVVLPGASPISLLEGKASASEGAAGSLDPKLELRPMSVAMSELRRGLPTRSAVESLGNGWYTAPDAQQRLRKELDAFASAGIRVRMLLGDGGKLTVVAKTQDGAMRYLLCSGFPGSTPVVFRDSPRGTECLDVAECGSKWVRGQELARLHAILNSPALARRTPAAQTLRPARLLAFDWRSLLIAAMCLARDIVLGPGEGDRPYARRGRCRKVVQNWGGSTEAEAAPACCSHLGGGLRKDTDDAARPTTKHLNPAASPRRNRRGGSMA